MEPFRIAVWGLGQHAFKNVLPAVNTSAQARLVGVYTRNKQAAEKACQQYCCRTWPDETAMLEDTLVDTVYLATPTGLHYEQALRVLRAGKHLLCEKSLTHSRETARKLVDAASQEGVLLAETFMYLYHPQFLFLGRLLTDQILGNIHTIQSNYFLPELANPGFRFNPELGGSAFLDAGCYPVSAVLALFPRKELPRVKYAMLRRDPGFEVDTCGSTLVEFSDGANACLNWGYGRAYRNELMVIGSEKSVYVTRAFDKRPDEPSRVEIFGRFGEAEGIDLAPADSFVQMFSRIQLAIVDEQSRNELLSQAERQSAMMSCIREYASSESVILAP